ncbi:hypothetical protein ES703_93352 [subsurface metagenome]
MTMERWRPGRGLIPWRPFRELGEMERRLEDIFGRPFLPMVWKRIPMVEMGWAPAIEVFEKEDRFVVKAELPGMTKEDIDISVIALPSTVDAKKIEASYEDGVLEVSLPKAAEVQPKKISVSAKKKEKVSK